MRIVDVFLEQCQRTPHASALQVFSAHQATQELTWSELESLMIQTAGYLHHTSNVRTGAHIATWLPNGLAWILIDLACQWMGWVHVALDMRLPASMVSHLVQHSQAQLLVLEVQAQSVALLDVNVPVIDAAHIERSRAQQFDALTSASIDEHSPAQLMYTSGTISHPKGALLSHRNLLTNARAKLSAAPQTSEDVRLNILPFAHAYARTCELSTWILSGSKLCIAGDWTEFLAAAPVVQPTLVNLVPHLVYRLVEQLERTNNAARLLGPRVRLLQVGGAALREDVWHRMASLGWPPLQGYGLTETSPVVCSNRSGQQRCDTVGHPVDGVEIRIDSQDVLWTRGPHVMLGYWRDQQATADKIHDGWFCTGDLAEQLQDGSLRILGRVDDQITLSTGDKVAPLELMRRLASDPWLESLVLVGQDRPYIAALIYPCLAKLPATLLVEGSDGVAINNVALTDALVQRWQPQLSDLPRSMQIQRVELLKEPLTVANGGLNFKGAVRRTFVEQHLCREEVERIYSR